jgi:hypothetical protein
MCIRGTPGFALAVPLLALAVPLLALAVPAFGFLVPLFIFAVPLFALAVPLFIYAVPLFALAVPALGFSVPLLWLNSATNNGLRPRHKPAAPRNAAQRSLSQMLVRSRPGPQPARRQPWRASGAHGFVSST